jgi:hypothetical protein
LIKILLRCIFYLYIQGATIDQMNDKELNNNEIIKIISIYLKIFFQELILDIILVCWANNLYINTIMKIVPDINRIILLIKPKCIFDIFVIESFPCIKHSYLLSSTGSHFAQEISSVTIILKDSMDKYYEIISLDYTYINITIFIWKQYFYII